MQILPSIEDTCITKTRQYTFDPLKPHFYIVKLGFNGVYIIFSHFAKNMDYGYSLEPLYQGGLTSTHNLCSEQKYEKYQIFFYLKIFLFGCKMFNIFELACFRNEYQNDIVLCGCI